MKKILALLLSLVMIISCSVVFAGAVFCEEENDEPLQFGSDGKFKVLQLADLQDGPIFRPLTENFINYLLDREKPDLVVLTGDNIAPGGAQTYGLTRIAINKYMSIFETRGVDVAIVYGNHDYDRNLVSKEGQWKIYESYDCFIGKGDSKELTGYGTYNLPIMSSDGEKVAFNLWFFDSQMGNTENDLGGYGCVAHDQIEWYVETENALKEANGDKAVPSFAFQHIVLPEVYDCMTKIAQALDEEALEEMGYEIGMELDEDKYYVAESGTVYEIVGDISLYDEKRTIVRDTGGVYVFPEEYWDENTFLGESCAPPRYSNGQADALVDNGDVLGIAVGHDHVNCFVLPYRGLDIVQTPTCSFGSYGDMNRGARVLVFDENDTSSYDTELIFFRDYYDLSDPLLYNRFVFNSESDDYTDEDRFVAMLKWFYYEIAYKFEEIISLFKF